MQDVPEVPVRHPPRLDLVTLLAEIKYPRSIAQTNPREFYAAHTPAPHRLEFLEDSLALRFAFVAPLVFASMSAPVNASYTEKPEIEYGMHPWNLDAGGSSADESFHIRNTS